MKRPAADPQLLAALAALPMHERVVRLRGILARSAALANPQAIVERARQRGVLADVHKAILGHRRKT